MEQSDGRISNLPAFCFLERGQWKEKEYEIRGGEKKKAPQILAGRMWKSRAFAVGEVGVFLSYAECIGSIPRANSAIRLDLRCASEMSAPPPQAGP